MSGNNNGCESHCCSRSCPVCEECVLSAWSEWNGCVDNLSSRTRTFRGPSRLSCKQTSGDVPIVKEWKSCTGDHNLYIQIYLTYVKFTWTMKIDLTFRYFRDMIMKNDNDLQLDIGNGKQK